MPAQPQAIRCPGLDLAASLQNTGARGAETLSMIGLPAGRVSGGAGIGDAFRARSEFAALLQPLRPASSIQRLKIGLSCSARQGAKVASYDRSTPRWSAPPLDHRQFISARHSDRRPRPVAPAPPRRAVKRRRARRERSTRIPDKIAAAPAPSWRDTPGASAGSAPTVIQSLSFGRRPRESSVQASGSPGSGVLASGARRRRFVAARGRDHADVGRL